MNTAIFRLQLFKVSEPFIALQALAFEKYHPVFVGQSLWGVAPNGAEFLTSHENAPRLLRGLSQIFPRADQRLTQELQKRKIGLIHAHFAIDAIYALPYATRLNVPLVTTLHGFDVTRTDKSLLMSCRPALINAALRRQNLQRSGDMFVCVSEHIKRAALLKGYPVEKLTVHYIGTDTKKYVPLDSRDHTEKYLVHVARLTEKKGTIFLLRALARIVPTNPSIKLKIVGDGPLRGELENEARQLGLSGHVTFLGARPFEETQNLIANAYAVVLPSITASNGDTEGLPMVTKEAGAFGQPLVVTDSGGIAEAVIDGKTGFIVPEKNVEALADRIERLLRDPDMARQIGLNARAHIEENFNVQKQSAKLERIYDEVIRRFQES